MSNVVAPGQLPLLPLHTLGWKGFQDLSGTILREILGQTYTIWSPTKDAGRDGAFVGKWAPNGSETLTGHFVGQCKHTSASDTPLTLSMLDDEFAKVRRLTTQGRADVYILFTNHRFTGELELAVGKRLAALGVKQSLVLGDHWMSAKVFESPRLRALVPRVYGIGDLSEVIDQRAQEQARAVLASLDEEIKTFVPVEAYRRAYEALDKHGFVCLVGEPGSGKTTIAAVLALVAADVWTLSPIRIHSPQEFTKHWNPTRSDQIFWIDDAFGDTQYEEGKSRGWRSKSRDLRAAHKGGARFVLTTRDYIFRRAKLDFQKGDLPVADLGQIQIEVEELTLPEKEAILYNHIKLGSQPKSFRSAIKKHLPLVAQRAHMLPEVAKRLAAPLFTSKLSITAQGVTRFAQDPDEYLLEVLQGLGVAERASLIALFASGGTLPSPIVADETIKITLEPLGLSLAVLADTLGTLRNTLVRYVAGSRPYWTYRHPTIHDAVSAHVSRNPELVGTYLRVAAIEQLVSEVYFEAQHKPEGAQVAVPRHLYAALVQRLVQVFDGPRALDKDAMQFLAYRVDDEFLQLYATAAKNLGQQLLGFSSYLDGSLELSILARLRALDVLDEKTRAAMVENVKQLAVETPDHEWLDSEALSASEQREILAHVKTEFVDDPYWIMSNWDSNYERDQSPDDYFAPLLSTIECYRVRFKQLGDADAVKKLEAIHRSVQQDAFDREEDYVRREPRGGAQIQKLPTTQSTSDSSRFDDLDE